jgi:hypothetical protein
MNKPDTNTPTSFKSIVEGACDSGLVSRKQWAIAADQDEEAVRRWQSGQWPRARALRRMLSDASLLPALVKAQIWAWWCNGTGRQALATIEPGAEVLDANGDQLVDAKDVLSFSIGAAERCMAALTRIQSAACGGELTDAEKSSARAMLHEVISKAQHAVAALDYEQPAKLRPGVRAAG